MIAFVVILFSFVLSRSCSGLVVSICQELARKMPLLKSAFYLLLVLLSVYFMENNITTNAIKVLWNQIPETLQVPMSQYIFRHKLKLHLSNELRG